ncbi:MAG: hypothetical protein RL367_1223 [Pseudomonadota bacterium]
MASLTVRNIPDEAKLRFRLIAAAHGRSMEAHLRQMIIGSQSGEMEPADALAETKVPFQHFEPAGGETQPKSFGQMLYDLSRPGIDLPIPPRTAVRIPAISGE